MTKFYSRNPQGDKIQEIIRNLSCVLNTKKGFGSYLKEMGIGDYNAYRSRTKIVETILREIKENINLYEPRVKLIDIREVGTENSFRLRFELKCEMIDHSQPIFLVFDSLRNSIMVE